MILQAAGRLLVRGVAELTILGDEVEVRTRAAELGVDLTGATVINPRTSELCERFAEQYAELRKKKGVTLVMVIQPPRGLMHREKLSSADRANYNHELAQFSYTNMLKRLRAAGIVVPDL